MPVLDAHALRLTLPMDNLQALAWQILTGCAFLPSKKYDRYASDFVDGEFYRRSVKVILSGVISRAYLCLLVCLE